MRLFPNVVLPQQAATWGVFKNLSCTADTCANTITSEKWNYLRSTQGPISSSEDLIKASGAALLLFPARNHTYSGAFLHVLLAENPCASSDLCPPAADVNGTRDGLITWEWVPNPRSTSGHCLCSNRGELHVPIYENQTSPFSSWAVPLLSPCHETMFWKKRVTESLLLSILVPKQS